MKLIILSNKNFVSNFQVLSSVLWVFQWIYFATKLVSTHQSLGRIRSPEFGSTLP